MPRSRNRLPSCSEHGCAESPFLRGFCKRHHEERGVSERRRNEAVDALHTGAVDGSPLGGPTLRDELQRLRRWWHSACDSLNYATPHAIFGDEAEYALSWCISLAQEIISVERQVRNGGSAETPMLDATRVWVWERFGFLENGLHSNGTPRSA